MTRQGARKPPIQTFVNQNAHDLNGLQHGGFTRLDDR